MTGSLQEKNGKFYAVLNFKKQDGTRAQKWINLNLPVRGNKRNAEAMLRDLLVQYQGIESIEPIPIDPPDLCPPPQELQSKHFNDSLLYIINR